MIIENIKLYRIIRGGHWERWVTNTGALNIKWIRTEHKAAIDGGFLRINCETHEGKKRNKVLIAVAFVLIVLISVVAFSQEYPDFIYSDDMSVVPGSHEVEGYIDQYWDMNPWSMGNPEGTFYTFGTICFADDFAEIDWNGFAGRICEIQDNNDPWGVPDQAYLICSCSQLHTITYPSFRIQWNEEAYSYINVFDGINGTHFTALACNLDIGECYLYQGVFKISNDEYIVDENYTFEAWKISSREHCLPERRIIENRKGLNRIK